MSATTNNKMAGSHVVKTEGDHGQNVVGAQVGRDAIHNSVVNNYTAAVRGHAAGEAQSKTLVVFVGGSGLGSRRLANSVIGLRVLKAYRNSLGVFRCALVAQNWISLISVFWDYTVTEYLVTMVVTEV